MVRNRFRFYLTIVLLILELASCYSKDFFTDAKTTVIEYFDYYASSPYEAILFNTSILHPDFVRPGVEGSRYYVITRDIQFGDITMFDGDFNVMNPHQESLIQVIAYVNTKYVIRDYVIEKEPKTLTMKFILSKDGTKEGKYLILSVIGTGYNLVYEDELVRYFTEQEDKENSKLYNSYKKATMME